MTKRDVLVLPSDGLDPTNRYLLSSTLDETAKQRPQFVFESAELLPQIVKNVSFY